MIRATIVWSSVLIVGLFTTSPDVLAQGSQTGGVTGTIRDATGAVLSGVAVTLASPNMIGGAQTLTTARDGEYRFTALPAGTYEITAGLQGFRMVKNRAIRLPAGAILTVDFELQVAGVSDVVTVSGRSPMVNVKSSSTPTVIDQEMLFNLPTNRSVANIINLTPGVSADVSFGGSQRSNALFVEGLSTTESLFQNPYTRLNYNWVQEVQVVGLGAGAEYGGFTGVAANSILRSGSNKFSGLAEYWTSRPSWVGRNTASLSEKLQQNFSPRQILSWWDSSAQLGGPIVQDRLWFFSGLQSAAHNDRPAGFSGPGSRDERDLQFLAKFTVALSPNVRLEAFSETGRYDVDGEYVDRSTPIESSNVVSQPQKNWNARLMWVLNPRTSLEVRHSGFVSSWSEEPRPPNMRSGPSPRWDQITQKQSGGPWNYVHEDQSERSTSATVTHYADRFLGKSHELKFGAEYETAAARQEYGYPGGRIYWDYAGEPYAVSLFTGGNGSSYTRRGVLFAQDTWTVNGRVTISPGVRFEINRGGLPSKGTIFSTNPTSPRIGAAWDVGGDHKTVIKAHYGQYHDALFASRIMFADPGWLNPYIYALVLGPDQFSVLSTSQSQGNNFAIDRNLRHSYVSQYVVGVERELFNDFSVLAQYIRRNFDTFMGLIDTGSTYAPVQRKDPGPDGRLGTSDDGDFLTVFNKTNPGNEFLLLTNPEQAFNRYNALQFVARKRYSHNWQMQASYTWSRNEGTVGNRWHVNAARFDLGSPGRFVNPNTFINAFGRATFDPTHEVKLLGTGRVPLWGGFSVSGVYRYTTGQAWGRRANIRGLQQGQERVRLEPQGTRRLPAINRLDFRAEKTFTPRWHGGSVGLFFDTFNLSNQGVPDSDITDAVNSFSGSTFGQPTRWVDPRLLRAGLRFSF